jgi:hypothetical protein
MKLESHLGQWQARGGQDWENIGLMARGTKEFSGTLVDERILQELIGKVRLLQICL